ncbi:hypothetical protein L7F22_052791 [Adiantum nelumboides]|nr:hypothetical protein [Adiantum nelumboides]
MDPAAPSNNSASVAAASSTTHKKKRFHGGGASALAHRRAGQHAQGMGGNPGAVTGEDDEGAFISSSRDASEEDNDDASGYSDSASSLRQPSSAHRFTSVASPLPTSARDKALVDSRDAHRKPVIASADKTPLSSSPTRNAVNLTQLHQASLGDPIAARSLPPDGFNDPHTSAMLSRATVALTSSGSTDFDEPIIASKSTSQPLARQESSAGSEASDIAAEGKTNEKKLSLGTLPVTTTNFANPTNLSATTPKAPAPTSGNPLTTIREVKKKSTTAHPNADGSETDGELTDGAAANPYDGDVEFAARSPVVQQPGVTGSGQHGFHSVSAAQNAEKVQGPPGHVGSTAPLDTPSRSYLSIVQITDEHQKPSSLIEKPIPMASVSNIRNFIHRAIHEPDPARQYRINPPPEGGKNPSRPVRIYADGVYDLFHYAHALQLRQAKLSFPCVHLIVGVVSSELCAAHKNAPVMTSQERYAAVRNCRWVDEVIEDAPWVINQEILDKLAIDYVAHDDLPYAGAGSSAEMSDIYSFCKDQGRFLPTQRTEGVSTSELLARIVEQYRNHNYDQKLAKIGHEELAFH